MSTLLYVQNDGLYADSRHLFNAFGLVRASHETNKIKLSEDKTFIWGYTGHLFTEDLKAIEKDIKLWLMKVYNHDIKVTELVPKHTIQNDALKQKFDLPIFDGVAFVVTKKQAWFIATSEEFKTKPELCANLLNYNIPYAGVGTGGAFAEGIMRVTANPTYAIQQAMNYDTVSGGEIQRVGFELLKEAKNY